MSNFKPGEKVKWRPQNGEYWSYGYYLGTKRIKKGTEWEDGISIKFSHCDMSKLGFPASSVPNGKWDISGDEIKNLERGW